MSCPSWTAAASNMPRCQDFFNKLRCICCFIINRDNLKCCSTILDSFHLITSWRENILLFICLLFHYGYDIVWAHFTVHSPDTQTVTKIRILVRIHYALTITGLKHVDRCLCIRCNSWFLTRRRLIPLKFPVADKFFKAALVMEVTSYLHNIFLWKTSIA